MTWLAVYILLNNLERVQAEICPVPRSFRDSIWIFFSFSIGTLGSMEIVFMLKPRNSIVWVGCAMVFTVFMMNPRHWSEYK